MMQWSLRKWIRKFWKGWSLAWSSQIAFISPPRSFIKDSKYKKGLLIHMFRKWCPIITLLFSKWANHACQYSCINAHDHHNHFGNGRPTSVNQNNHIFWIQLCFFFFNAECPEPACTHLELIPTAPSIAFPHSYAWEWGNPESSRLRLQEESNQIP